MSIVDKLLEAEGDIVLGFRRPDLSDLLREAASEYETLAAVNAELLEALEMVAKPIFAHANGDKGPYVTDEEFDEWHQRFLIAARAAIAKAKGGDHDAS